ncbi:MAG: GGDEF domain-containing protein [Clostridiales bacterium]|nr:GGDEF domain-containing protein [Clostridiales bacterium]
MVLKIFIRLVSEDLASALANVVTEHRHITTEFDRGDTPVTKPSDCIGLIVTDDSSRFIESCHIDDTPLKSFYNIFYGEPDTEIFSKADDVFPSSEKTGITAARLIKNIDRIASDFDAWMYSSMLYTTINSLPDLIWYKDARGAHLAVNTAFCKTVHKPLEDIRGRGHYYIWDITPEEYATGEYVCMESETETMKSGKTCVFDEPLKTGDGMKQLQTFKTPLYDPFGRIYGTVGIGKDVTDFANMGVALSLLIENVPFPLVLCDNNWDTFKMNSSFFSLFKVDPDQSFNYIQWKREHLKGEGHMHATGEKATMRNEYTYTDGNKEMSFVVTERVIYDHFDNPAGHMVFLRDITFEKTYEQDILKAANTDVLTGLFNRRYFYSYLTNNTGSPMTLLYMDLDRFKEINDKFGHSRGDDVLKRTADLIRKIFPEAIAARLGGDEFAALFKGLPDEDILAHDIKDFEEAVIGLVRRDSEDDPYLTVSIGIVRCEEVDDIDSFIHAGDSRMYEIKKEHHKMNH